MSSFRGDQQQMPTEASIRWARCFLQYVPKYQGLAQGIRWGWICIFVFTCSWSSFTALSKHIWINLNFWHNTLWRWILLWGYGWWEKVLSLVCCRMSLWSSHLMSSDLWVVETMVIPGFTNGKKCPLDSSNHSGNLDLSHYLHWEVD